MRGIRVHPSLVETVLERMQADSVTVRTRFDAFHHFIVRHEEFLSQLSGVLVR
jgi:hypothetical protein